MTEWPPLRDYTKSRAVVMGTWDFEHLPRIPAAANSLNRMIDLLTGPLCGWPEDRLLVLANERRPGDLPDRLITAFEDITDVALFYYVGHGQMDSEGRLCLCLTESRTEANRRATTSLTFPAVRQAMLDSAAATKIVLVDCCFAGLASQSPANTLGARADDIADVTSVSGTYTMAASGEYAKAAYEIDPGIALPQTYFTKYLADLVEAGVPDERPGLRLHQLFLRLRDNLARDQLPVPHERSVDAARDFVFAHNAAPPDTIRDPDNQLRQLAERLAAATAREEALRAQVEERTRELERLHKQAGHIQLMAAEQQQQLRDEIGVAERRLDETVERLDETAATHAIVEAERSELAVTAAPRETRPALPPVTRRRLRPLRLLAGIGYFLLLAALCSADSAARPVHLITTLTSGSGGGGFSDAAFSPDGEYLAASGTDGRSVMWDMATLSQVRTFTDPGKDPETIAVAFSPESNAIAIAIADSEGNDGGVYLWNLPGSAKPITVSGPGMDISPAGLAFDPAGGTLAVACDISCNKGYEVTNLWALARHRFTDAFADPGGNSTCGLDSIAFSRDGRYLAASDCDGSTYLWNVKNARTVLRTFTNPGESGSIEVALGAVAFSPDGKMLAVYADGASVYLFNVSNGSLLATLPALDGGAMAFSPDGKILALGGPPGLQLWNVAARKVIATLANPRPRFLSIATIFDDAIAFNPDGTILALVANGNAYLWDTSALTS